jgi:dTDP-4-dehydrorhamnose reductase
VNKQKIIIVGATGYVGKALYAAAKACSETLATSSSGVEGTLKLDLLQPDAFPYQVINPGDTVLLTAAISAPDICAREYDRAWALNVEATSQFIAQVIASGGRVVFFSSDTVYGTLEQPFDERAECQPAGEYALMKREVEKRFTANPGFKSIRLSYVFSREDKFTRYLQGCAERREPAELFHPFYRSIVHRNDVIAGALALAQRWDEFPERVINFGGPETLSRVEMAETIRAEHLVDLQFSVVEPEPEFFKNRPRVIAMTSPVFTRLLGRRPHRLVEAVEQEFAAI